MRCSNPTHTRQRCNTGFLAQGHAARSLQGSHIRLDQGQRKESNACSARQLFRESARSGKAGANLCVVRAQQLSKLGSSRAGKQFLRGQASHRDLCLRERDAPQRQFARQGQEETREAIGVPRGGAGCLEVSPRGDANDAERQRKQGTLGLPQEVPCGLFVGERDAIELNSTRLDQTVE